jgi:hypothetical protein
MVSLAKSWADSKGPEMEAELTQLSSIKQQKRVAHNIKQMQGKLQKNVTVQITNNTSQGRRQKSVNRQSGDGKSMH